MLKKQNLCKELGKCKILSKYCFNKNKLPKDRFINFLKICAKRIAELYFFHELLGVGPMCCLRSLSSHYNYSGFLQPLSHA